MRTNIFFPGWLSRKLVWLTALTFIFMLLGFTLPGAAAAGDGPVPVEEITLTPGQISTEDTTISFDFSLAGITFAASPAAAVIDPASEPPTTILEAVYATNTTGDNYNAAWPDAQITGAGQYILAVFDGIPATDTYGEPVAAGIFYVTAPDGGYSVLTDFLPPALAGESYDFSLAAAGGTPPYSWSITNGYLPPGLTLQADGTISGIPDTPGDYSFTVEVQDSADPASLVSKQLTLAVDPASAGTGPEITPGGVFPGQYPAGLPEFGIEFMDVSNIDAGAFSHECDWVRLKDPATGSEVACSYYIDDLYLMGENYYSVEGIKMATTDPAGLQPGSYDLLLDVNGVQSNTVPVEVVANPYLMEWVFPGYFAEGRTQFRIFMEGFNLSTATFTGLNLKDGTGNAVSLAGAPQFNVFPADEPEDGPPGLECLEITFTTQAALPADDYTLEPVTSGDPVVYRDPWMLPCFAVTGDPWFFEMKEDVYLPGDSSQTVEIAGINAAGSSFDVYAGSDTGLNELVTTQQAQTVDGKEFLVFDFPGAIVTEAGEYWFEIFPAGMTTGPVSPTLFFEADPLASDEPAPLDITPSGLPEGYGDTAMTLTDATTGQDTWTAGEILDVRVMIVDDPETPPTQEAAVDITSFTVNENTIELTMPAGLAAGDYAVEVLRGGQVIAASGLPVNAAVSQAANIIISGSGTLDLPASGTTSGQYTAVVQDQSGQPLTGETVSWSFGPAAAGISLTPGQDNSVTVTVDTAASPGTITLQAVADSNQAVLAQKTISIVDTALPALTVGSAAALPGETVTIPVSIDTFSGMTGYGITVQYDPAVLTPVDAVNGDILGDSMFIPNLNYTSNQVKLTNSQAEAATSGSVLFTLTFEVNAAAPAGAVSPLTVPEGLVFDGENQQMDVNCISGQVEVIDVVYGDVTGDKNVWPNDATAVLRCYVGLDQFDSNQLKAGDVTGDGNVWPNDATAILRYYVGLDDQFAVEM